MLGLLLSGEQRLFRRASSETNPALPAGYGISTGTLPISKKPISSLDVRFHIKQVIFALLSELSEPEKGEWDIVSGFTGRDFSDPVTRHAWGTVRCPAWFRLVDSQGLVQHWLGDPDESFVDQTVLLLRVIQSQLPDRVAELVEPYVGEVGTLE